MRSFGSMANLYATLENSSPEGAMAREQELEAITPSIRKALVESKSDIMQAYKLIGLMPAPIDCTRLLAPQEPKPTYEEAEVEIGSELPDPPLTESKGIHLNDAQIVAIADERAEARAATTEQPARVALVRAADDGWAKSLEPRSLEQAIVLAKRLFSSRLFGDVGNEDGALAKIMAGRSFGLDAMASLRGLNVIKGKVGMSSALMKGLCQASPLCEYFRHVESNERYAVYVTKRSGDPEVRWRYTIEQARKAGLLEQDQWKRRPDVMLRWRCIAELARDQYPDIIMNCYTPDEMAEIGE